MITITQQPQDASISVDQSVIFSVEVDSPNPVTYQWYENGTAVRSPRHANIIQTASATSNRFFVIGALSKDAYTYFVEVTDGEETVISDTATLSVTPAEFFRSGLIWNYEDNNFSWFDAAVDKTTFLEPTVCMKYQPDPGWQVRWSDLMDLGLTWEDLQTALTKWSDFYSGTGEENLYWLTNDGVYVADQRVKTDGLKAYIAERVLIDLNDVVPQFTTDKWIFAKQLYLMMKGLPDDTLPNPVHLAIGWADTIMGDPSYGQTIAVNLQSKANGGSMKADFRSTGRYLALKMWFNQASKIQLTGAELDAEQKHGR